MTLQELSEHYQLRAQLEKDEDILYNLRMAAIPSAHPLDGMPRAPDRCRGWSCSLPCSVPR